MPIGPYGGAPGFRDPSMRSPKPGLPMVSKGYAPEPRPMATQRPAGSQMFSGANLTGTRAPTSPAGVRTTPYEAYASSGPDNRMNQKEFWQSGQAGQYAPVNLMRQALGMEQVDNPFMRQAMLQRRRQGQGRSFGGDGRPFSQGGEPTYGGFGSGANPKGGGVYGGGTFNPQPRPMGGGTYTAPYSTFGPGGTNPLPAFGGATGTAMGGALPPSFGAPIPPPNPYALPTTMPVPYSTTLR